MKYKAQQYFDRFSDKDILGLQKMFHTDIELVDWDINVKGIEKVIEANTKIFNSVDSIKVSPLKIVGEDNNIFAELLITIINNGQTSFLHVVDVITFKDGKIYSIHAYKR